MEEVLSELAMDSESDMEPEDDFGQMLMILSLEVAMKLC